MMPTDLSHISRNTSAQNARYQTVYNATTVTDGALSAITDQLSRKVEEFGEAYTQRLCQIENLLKDQNQKISDLEKLIKGLADKPNKNSNSAPNLPVKNNTIYNFNSSFSHNLVYRMHGFSSPAPYGLIARDNDVMLEFVSPFPRKFTLDINAHCFDESYLNKDFEIYIGKIDEKRYKKEFKLFKREGKDYANLLFEIAEEDNNTVWISIPTNRYGGTAGLNLHSLNIIPR